MKLGGIGLVDLGFKKCKRTRRTRLVHEKLNRIKEKKEN